MRGSGTTDGTLLLVLLFLLAGVAAPAACVLWFMNAAASSQAASARQSVMEAYRGQLRLIRDRVEADWDSRAKELAKQAARGTPEDFARIVAAHSADSVIFLRPDGTPTYPARPKPPMNDPAADRNDWRAAQELEQRHNWQPAIAAYGAIAKSNADASVAARAAQGEIRAVLQTNKSAAVDTILQYFASGRLVNATDLHGRMIAADEHLLAFRLMPTRDPRRATALRRLTGWINDYRSPMPSSQRLFLMNELSSAGVQFPTYDAEKLGAQVLESEPVRAGAGLEAIRVPQLWKLTVKGGQAIVLLRDSTVAASQRSALNEAGSNSGAVFELIPPGMKQPDEAIAAGPMLPGWQIAFTLRDTNSVAEAARRRTTRYIVAGYIVVAAVCITGLLLGQALRRQMRLTRLKTDLVATVSHELKTPLASMRLLVDTLLEDVSPNPLKTREYLQLIAGENLRLTRLIENFLAFSRIERRRQSFEFRETDPLAVVEAAASAVRERFHVETEVEPDLPSIDADEDALVTVLLNLLDNAYKYTPAEKRIILRAYSEASFSLRGTLVPLPTSRAEARRRLKPAPQNSSHVIFSVEDNGIGIAPREQKRIFRKFYQVDRRLARETGGCGLGLSIVDYIVRAHGGVVRVQSRPGAGSTFSVAVPFRRQAKGAAA
ncbi:MAG: hypothetical protein JO307_05240 [Bryobacterales bacterium]|nr:hypothetical protein [Bryobacterales bacterium]